SAPLASDITVSCDLSDPNVPTLVFSGFSLNALGLAGALSTADMSIAFTVTAPSPRIGGVSLSDTGSADAGAGGAASSQIDETVKHLPGGNVLGTLSVFNIAGGGVKTSDFLALNPAETSIRVEKDVNVQAFGVGSAASISIIDQDFHQVIPEPA